MDSLEQFINRQLEEEQKKADEEREKMRIKQEEEAIKIENQKLTTETNPFLIHSSQSFEIIASAKEEQDMSLVNLEKLHDQKQSKRLMNEMDLYRNSLSSFSVQGQQHVETTSKYFNESLENKAEPLKIIENTIDTRENEVSSPIAAFDVDDNNELPILSNPLKEDHPDKIIENDFETINDHDLMPPPQLTFIKPKYEEANNSSNDTPSSFLSDNDTIHFSCQKCSSSLIQGHRSDIELIEVHDLEYIQDATKNRCIVQEIQNPAFWKTSSHLIGGPLDIQSLPSRESLLYDRTDELCFRLLACDCNPSVDLGMVVCLATNPAKTHHVGKVYLWGFIDSALTNGKTSPKFEHLYYNAEDLDMEIPNSQYSSTNDIFYNL
jgi:hypothetical protein